MKTRASVINWFLGILDELQPGNANVAMYEAHFKTLPDKQLKEMAKKLADGTMVLPYYAPHWKTKDIEVSRSLAVAEKLGIKIFQRIWMTDTLTGVKFLSVEYMLLTIPVRRQMQHMSKGKSVTVDSSSTDDLTGQPTWDSKASRLSLPEIANLNSLGLNNGVKELIGARGGNVLGFRLLKRKLLDTGSYTLAEVDAVGSRPTSTDTARAFLFSMHLDNNL